MQQVPASHKLVRCATDSAYGLCGDANLRARWFATVSVIRGDVMKWALKQSKQVTSAFPLLAALVCAEGDGTFVGAVDGFVDHLHRQLRVSAGGEVALLEGLCGHGILSSSSRWAVDVARSGAWSLSRAYVRCHACCLVDRTARMRRWRSCASRDASTATVAVCVRREAMWGSGSGWRGRCCQ